MKLSETDLNERKAHLQEGSQPSGQRKFTTITPLGTFVFRTKKDAKAFKALYDSASKHYPDAAPKLVEALQNCVEQLQHYLQGVEDGADDDAESAYQFGYAVLAEVKSA